MGLMMLNEEVLTVTVPLDLSEVLISDKAKELEVALKLRFPALSDYSLMWSKKTVDGLCESTTVIVFASTHPSEHEDGVLYETDEETEEE